MQYKGKFRSVLIFGPPGSGKGTQSKLICEGGNHVHLSTGDIFRGLSKESPAGKLFYAHANKGELVPDDLAVEIWLNYVQGLIATNSYFPEKQYLFLDGIPRTVAQVEQISRYIEVQAIILLESKHPKVLIDRILRRAGIEGRSDDSEREVLEKRMEVFEKQTFNVLSKYPKDLIFYFNAEQRPLEVLRDILNKLANKL